MVFSSTVFLFLFLPVFLSVYYLTPFRFRSHVILAASVIFYGWWRIDFLALMLSVILWSYFIAAKIEKYTGTGSDKKYLILGIVLNIGTLAVFKYFNFGIDTMNLLLKDMGFGSIEAIRILLPIGISFYIFHAISFLIDIYRRDAHLPKNIVDFAAFITLFPQLVAGPILRFKDLAFQFEARDHNFDKFSQGARRFMTGFAKKVLIADTVAPLADAAFALPMPSMADGWLGAVAYAIQLYFDFSGYSDMAVGLGLMMGFRFIENFNAPYLSKTITEFWRRWHISLSTWLRDYLYIPLGGNRRGENRTSFNIIITMLLGGLWHGANWTFVLWGLLHGSVMAIERRYNFKGSQAGCIFIVLIGWVLFRSDNIADAVMMYKGMSGLHGISISDDMGWQIKGVSMAALIGGIGIVYAGPRMEHIALPLYAKDIMIFGIFVAGVARLLAQSYSPFLYFKF